MADLDSEKYGAGFQPPSFGLTLVPGVLAPAGMVRDFGS